MATAAIEYKAVTYKKFITELQKAYAAHKDKHERTESEVAVCLGVSGMTVRNCLEPSKQIVTDKLLTKLFDYVGLGGKIEWAKGEKHFYLENK